MSFWDHFYRHKHNQFFLNKWQVISDKEIVDGIQNMEPTTTTGCPKKVSFWNFRIGNAHEKSGPFWTMPDKFGPYLHFELFGPFWTVSTILDHFGSFWTVWTILDRFVPFWTILDCLDHFGPFWTVWTILDRFGPFWTVWTILSKWSKKAQSVKMVQNYLIWSKTVQIFHIHFRSWNFRKILFFGTSCTTTTTYYVWNQQRLVSQ